MTPEPTFRVLGPLEVVDGAGRPIELGGPKPRTLLAVLLLDAGRVVSIDRLIEALWGDEPPASAQGTLQAYVSNLRRALAVLGGGDGAPLLRTQAPGYRLEAGGDDVDAVRFERLAADGAARLGDGRTGEALVALAAARALWRGPVLGDLASEPFAIAEAQRLDELRLQTVERWCEAALAEGHHADVVAQAPPELAAHPLRSRLRAHVMVALYRSGRQAEALRCFAEGRAVLREELGTEPEPELRALEEQILRHDPRLDAGRSTVTRPAAGADPAPSAGEGDVALVGRDHELATLRAAVTATTAGHGGVVLLAGEAGIGKTRLAEAVVAQATPDAVVAWGRSFEAEGTPAFWPWVEVLRQAVAGAAPEGPGAVFRDVGPDAGLLVRLVPEWLSLLPAAGAPLDGADDRLRHSLNDAVARTLHAVAARRPLVIVLDDLHWADGPTLRLLVHLATTISAHPMLVVATYRDDEVDGELADAIAGLIRSPAVDRLELRGLGGAEIERLLRASLTIAPTPAVVHDVAERSGGNPFFVGELARLLDAGGPSVGATASTGVGAAVPPGIRDVIRRRIERLPAGVDRLLTAAALIGREFDLRTATLVADLDDQDDTTLDLVDAALAANLITEGGRAGRYRFAHALVQDALTSALSGPRRARMHKRIAEVLASNPRTGRPEDLAALAFHALAGASAADAEAALLAAVVAAGAALAALSFEEAADLCASALAVAGRTGAGAPEIRFRLQVDLGIARRRQGDVEGAREALADALATARAREGEEGATRFADAALHFSGGAWWGWWSELGAADEAAIATLEEALDRLPDAPSAQRAQLLARLAIELHFVEGAETRRDEVSAEALTMARDLDDVTRAQALAARHIAIWRPGNADERRALAEELVATARAVRSPELEAFGHHYLLIAALERGDAAAAAAQLDEGERSARALPLPHLTAQVAWSRSLLAAVAGRFDEAEGFQNDALATTSRWSEMEAFRTWSAQLSALRWEQGRGIELADALRDLVARETIDSNWKAGLALVLADDGQLEEAASVFDEVAAEGFADVPQDLGRLFNLTLRAITAALLQDRRRSHQLLPPLEPLVGEHVVQPSRLVYAGPVSFHVGCLRLVTGDLDLGIALLERALDEAGRIGAPSFRARTLVALARGLAARGADGDEARAVALAGEAHALATALGMVRVAARAEAAGAGVATDGPRQV